MIQLILVVFDGLNTQLDSSVKCLSELIQWFILLVLLLWFEIDLLYLIFEFLDRFNNTVIIIFQSFYYLIMVCHVIDASVQSLQLIWNVIIKFFNLLFKGLFITKNLLVGLE